MSTAKQTVQEILNQLDDDATLEDVQYQLYLRQRIGRARQELAEGEGIDHQEVEQRVSQWLDESDGPR